MRESSLKFTKNLSQQPKRNRGGEKKVMKKSLSTVVAMSMVASMFANVAFAAETSMDAQAKFDALKKAGVFDGYTDGSAGLDKEMSRAEFAAVIVRLLDLEKVSSTSSYKDVADHWGHKDGYIEAVTKAKIMDGVADGEFNPDGKVTKEQLATILVRALGLQAEADASVEGTVSDWAKGFVAAAIKAGLLTAEADYTVNAKRDQLVSATYAAQDKVPAKPGAKVSVASAAPVGVQKVEVKFNQAVDTDKAKLALTKGTQSIATSVKFADDKKSAILTLTDVKVSEGSYKVTLSGLDAANVDKTVAEFTAENEKVAKLSFVNASEKIAKSKSVMVRIKSENQYGENATITGGNYTAYIAGQSATPKRNDDNGLLELEIDAFDKPNGGGAYQAEIDVIPVNVFLTNSSVSAQKTFKVGTEPYVTKIELGEVKYPGDKKALTVDGDVAEVKITRYDQYGDVISKESKDKNSIAAALGVNFKDRLNYDAVITPYTFDALVLDNKASQDPYDTLKFRLAKNVDKDAEYTATVYVGSSNATVNIKTQSSKVATKVEFGTFNGVLAEGDVNKYIPIVAYDNQGNKLSAQDIADNAKSERFSISISGANYASTKNGNDAIVQSGEHKGKIKLDQITSGSKGVVYINLGIFNANIQQNVQQSFTVQDARKPETIVIDGSTPAQKAIIGGETKIKWFVKDQHGEELKKVSTAANAKYAAGDFTLRLTVTGDTYADFTTTDAKVTGKLVSAGVYEFNATQFEDFNKIELKLKGKAEGGKAKLKAELFDNTKTTATSIRSIENSVEVIGAKDLVYNVSSLKDSYAALDSKLVDGTDKDLAAGTIASKLARKIEVKAKDKSGNDVAIPAKRIISASTDNGNVAQVAYDATNKEAYVIGNKAGTANVLVVFEKAGAGEGAQDVTLPITVKADAVSVASMSIKANKTGIGAGTHNLTEIVELKVKDNYDIEYKFDKAEDFVYKYKGLLGVSFVVSDVKGTGTAVVVANDTTKKYELVITGTVDEFVLKAVAPSGVSATSLITK
jgi:trimeric autotransporter adhesin